MTSTETRTVQERLRGNSTACLVNGLPDTAALLSEAADRIDALEKAFESVATYCGTLYGASEHDVRTADPADVTLNGVPVVAWRKAYKEGVGDLASEVVGRFPPDLKDRCAELAKSARIATFEKESDIARAALSPPSDNEVK